MGATRQLQFMHYVGFALCSWANARLRSIATPGDLLSPNLLAIGSSSSGSGFNSIGALLDHFVPKYSPSSFRLKFSVPTMRDSDGKDIGRISTVQRETPWLFAELPNRHLAWQCVMAVLPGSPLWRVSIVESPCSPRFGKDINLDEAMLSLRSALMENLQIAEVHFPQWAGEFARSIEILDGLADESGPATSSLPNGLYSHEALRLVEGVASVPPMGCMGGWDDWVPLNPTLECRHRQLCEALADAQIHALEAAANSVT